MKRYIRQVLFMAIALVFRWPIWMLVWVFGKTGIFKTIFLIYPVDKSECLDFCPDIKILRNFLSGRPTPSGLIMKGWRPMGIYLAIPNPALELMRGKSRPTVEAIIRRLLWIQKISGATAIGLAGQLGPIFEKRHGIPMNPPFYTSTFGNIFSIQSAVNHLSDKARMKPWQSSLAILGGGELGEQLMEQLSADGYRSTMVDVRYTKKGDIKLSDENEADLQLEHADFVVNLLPRGKDFMDCSLHLRMPESATVIDFSRPPIRPEDIPQKVCMGNRVQRSGIQFMMRLPGGWKCHELPACSMPSIVASLTGVHLQTLEEFRQAARQLAFRTALAGAPAPARGGVRGFIDMVPGFARLSHFFKKNHGINPLTDHGERSPLSSYAPFMESKEA